MKTIKAVSAILGVVFGGLALSACDGGDSNALETTNIRVNHVSVDAPPVQIQLDNMVFGSNSYDYGESTGIGIEEAKTHTLSVDAILPDGTMATVLGPVTQAFEADINYDVFAIGSVADQTLEVFLMSAPAEFDDTMVRVAVAHLTEAAPMVDVHVTAPGAQINAGTVLGSFSYKETLGPVEIPAGDYQIRVTPAGSLDVVYDSGRLSLTAGSDLVIGAVPNAAVTPDTAAAKSPVSLMVVGPGSASLVYSVSDGADLRVVHSSPDAPAVDVVVNDGFDAPLVEDLAFTDFTGYVNVPADTYNVKIAAADTMNAVIDADLTLENAGIYSVLAVNTVNSIEPLVLVDMPRPVATEAKLRAIHGSTLAGEVDLYITAPGADITGTAPTVSGFVFKADTGYVSLMPGDYDVTVTPTGSKTAALGPLTVSLDALGIYTILARDEAALNGVNVTLLDDFNP